MSLIYLFKFALKKVLQTKWKNLLGVSGVIISVVLMVFLVSIGNGFNTIVDAELNNPIAQKTILVRPGKTEMLKITQDNINSIKDISGVEKIEEQIELSGKYSFKGSTADVLVQGVSPGYFQLNSIELPPKVELITAQAVESQPIIINFNLAKMFGFKKVKDFVGQEIVLDYTLTKSNSKTLLTNDVNEKTISGKKFRVLAVVEDGGQPTVYAPYSIVSADGADFDSKIQVLTANPYVVSTIRAKIESKGFTTENIVDSIKNIHSFFSMLNIFLLIIGLIGIIASTLGLLNLSAVSYSSRITEIAWLKVMGMSNTSIRLALVFEQIIISFFAFLVGLIISILFGLIVNFIVEINAIRGGYSYMGIFKLSPIFTTLLIIFSLLFGLFIGLISSKKIYSSRIKLGIKHD